MFTFQEYLTENANLAADDELNGPSHDVLTNKLGYQQTPGTRMKEGKFRQYTYKHPETNATVHTFINRHAENPEQRVQHWVNKKFVHPDSLESEAAAAARR